MIDDEAEVMVRLGLSEANPDTGIHVQGIYYAHPRGPPGKGRGGKATRRRKEMCTLRPSPKDRSQGGSGVLIIGRAVLTMGWAFLFLNLLIKLWVFMGDMNF